jgi:quercetin dioxygenase-like cupin family protein
MQIERKQDKALAELLEGLDNISLEAVAYERLLKSHTLTNLHRQEARLNRRLTQLKPDLDHVLKVQARRRVVALQRASIDATSRVDPNQDTSDPDQPHWRSPKYPAGPRTILESMTKRTVTHGPKRIGCAAEITFPRDSCDDDVGMTSDIANFDLSREITEAEERKPWPSGLRAKVLDKRPDIRVMMVSLAAGARMKEHRVDGSSCVHLLRGHIRYSALDQVHDLRAGDLLTVGASIQHEVEAVDESTFLLTISWPPGK